MQTAKLEITESAASNGTSIATLSGKLSLETVGIFLQDVRSCAAERLVLDMSRITYLDSAGVGALVQAFVHRRTRSQKTAVAALTQQGHAIMQVAGLTKLVPIFATVEEASSSL